MRLILIAAGAAAGRGDGWPRHDDPPAPVSDAAATWLTVVTASARQVWNAPERAAAETAALLDLATTPEPRLAMWTPSLLDDGSASGDDGESLADLLARTHAWLGDVATNPARPAGSSVVIAAPPVVRALVVNALGAGEAAFWRLDIAMHSISVLTHAGASWRVRSCGTPPPRRSSDR